MKTFIGYGLLLLLGWSCTKGGGAGNNETHDYPDPNDYTVPVLVVNTPGDNQVFSNGSSINVTGNISDNSLFQGSITIQNNTTGTVVKDQYYVIHYIPSYDFSMSYIATVTSSTDFTVTVRFEDHGHNVASKSIKVTVNP
jgi:hypothetical protein